MDKDTLLKLDDAIVLRVSKGGGETGPTETTEEKPKDENSTVSVRFTVPNREEPYLLTILQDGAVVVEDAKVPAGVSVYTVTLTGKGTKEYDICRLCCRVVCKSYFITVIFTFMYYFII